jgi:hypothetical protein
MEVHHHTSPGHSKKWSGYLLEFFMLFLAVFLGFIAENVREHTVEHNRAREFARSLVKDLQDDIIAVKEHQTSTLTYMAAADSLLELSKSKLEGRNAAEFSFYTRFVYWTAPVKWHRTTFEQIKNSGSLRYFKSRLLSKLMKYDAEVNDIQDEFSNHKIRGNMLLGPINRLIDPALHRELSNYFIWSMDSIPAETKEHFFSAKVSSLENRREDVNELLNMVVVQQRNLRNGYDTNLPRAIELAKELITDLQKEYHLREG